ncbi:phosphopantetheinyl transferase [Emydomyces testavorans]|uniref:Phosphopantetheinyl transferase n=1 Tax=Emydomyces testavorans TaxID=2070801 RepID=A0AAF0DJG6_9EURO|nr:phosphopantetheinyl transferase [Emydomyces testavorans]
MKAVAFPFALNVGTDIVHIPRVFRLVTRPSAGTTPYLHRFIRRILSEQEQAHFLSKFPQYQPRSSQPPIRSPSSSHPPNAKDMARWLAGRFAAKEAARKAAPGGAASISWKEVVVRNEPKGNGRPEVVFLRDGKDVGQIGKLSISHDGEYVVATVIAAANSD